MTFVWLLVIVFLSGMFYFEHMLNRSGMGALLLILTIAAGVYWIGWKSLIAVVVGLYVGSKLVREQMKKLSEQHEQIMAMQFDDTFPHSTSDSTDPNTGKR